MKRFRLGIFLACSLLVATAGVAVAAGLGRAGHSAAPARIAFSQGNSLYVANVDGSNRTLIGTGNYSWYSWSPDGRYLLVAKSFPRIQNSQLMLYDPSGRQLRTLVRRAPWSGFYASWASNADQVAFVAGRCDQTHTSGCAHPYDQAVYSVDVQGNRTFLASYQTSGGGCGGGLQDPAADLYRIETDFGVTMPTLHWAAGRPISFLGVMGYEPPQPAGKRLLQIPSDIAVSSQGNVAATIERCSGSGCAGWVVLVNPQSGRVLRWVGAGELPAWSPDGGTLFFVRRTVVGSHTFHDSYHNTINSSVYRSEIWRVMVTPRSQAKGGVQLQGMHRLVSYAAYGFGPMSVSPDGRTIVVSRTGNATRLWQHRLSGDRFDAQLVKAYGPRVSIERIDVATGTATALLANAGRPTAQPV